jgi:hypothetical protein
MAKFDHCESCGKYDLVRRTIVDNIVRMICINCTYTPSEGDLPRPRAGPATGIGDKNSESAPGL